MNKKISPGPFNDLDIYSRIFNSISNPIFVKNSEHRFVMVNDAFCVFFHVKPEDFVGKKDDELFPKTEWKIYRERDIKILTTGVPDENEEYATIPGGARLRVMTKKSLLQTSKGEKYVLGIVTDITEKTALLRKIRESEILHKALFNMTPNMILIHYREKIVFINHAVMDFFNQTMETIVGQQLDDLFRLRKNPAERKNVKEYFSDLQVTSAPGEIQVSDPEGEWNNFLVRNARIRYKGKDAFMSVLTNITERKNIESIVLNRTIEAEENEAKRFATDLHDDLGPILSSIQIYLRVVRKAEDSEKREEALEIFENLLNEVTHKIHRISHYLTPHLIVDFGLEASVSNLCQVIGKNEDFKITFNSNLNNARFPKDIELHFYRIISELLNNSIKHSHGNNMNLVLHQHDEMLLLKYHDDGKGYDVPKILKKPTGIGVPNIVQRVHIMKGDISFKRLYGKTRVTIKVFLKG